MSLQTKEGLFYEMTPQWLMTIFKYLKEDNRCYYGATSLLALGVVYFMNKLFSFKKSKMEKSIELPTAESADVSLEKTNNLNESANIIKCKPDYTKAVVHNCDIPDSSIASSERDAVSDSLTSEHSNLSPKTILSQDEILPAATSDFKSIPLESSTITRNVSILNSYISESQFKSMEALFSASLRPELVASLPASLSSDLEAFLPPVSLSSDLEAFSPPVSRSPELEALPSVSLSFEFEALLPSAPPYPNYENLTLETLHAKSRTLFSESSTSFEDNFFMSTLPVHENLSSDSFMDKFKISPSLSLRPEIKNVPSEISTSNLIDFQSTSAIPKSEILCSEHSRTEFEMSLSISPMHKLDILPSEFSMTEKEVLHSESSITDFEILPSVFPIPDVKNLSSISPVSSLENFTSSSQIIEPDFLLSDPSKLGTKTVLSDETVLLKQQNEFKIQVPSIQSQANETFNSFLPSSINDSSKTLLPNSKTESDSSVTDESSFEVTVLQDSKQEAKTKLSVEGANNILLNERVENGDTSLTNLNTDEFPLDTIPLEMIYKIIPMSMQ